MRCKDCYPIQWCPCGLSLNRCGTFAHEDMIPYEVKYVNGILVYRCETCHTNEYNESRKKKQPKKSQKKKESKK